MRPAIVHQRAVLVFLNGVCRDRRAAVSLKRSRLYYHAQANAGDARKRFAEDINPDKIERVAETGILLTFKGKGKGKNK